MRVFVIGASGGVGARVVAQAVARGHRVTAQSRTAGRIRAVPGVDVAAGRPDDARFLAARMRGHEAVVMSLGVDRRGPTTLFSDATRATIAAMRETGVRRLVAITGVGAGDTRGHGGWFYNRIVFPFVTRHRYADKDRQEALIERADLDWTLVRPAPFAARPGRGAWQAVLEVPHDLQLRAVTRDEVAAFVVECLETGGFLRCRPFIGRS
ncbi:NAD(P)H-binding protein [Luteimonas sp. FCS-9]|uniref:NAD(P)-dependent oxidoreductase n=1 Tax=Luteimonas sp. FCS-9 TaxID=1547516 RepID=UPI00063E83D3|nr:NAD(P)H-binding protein [Luteimonas sp. FCS-9]KLJ02894.1 epimerase [Luteimonas sp. FCS-9]